MNRRAFFFRVYPKKNGWNDRGQVGDFALGAGLGCGAAFPLFPKRSARFFDRFFLLLILKG